MRSSTFLLPLAAAEGGGGGILSVDTTLLWSTVVLFILFAWVLGKFAWRPLLKIVDEREKSIRGSVESAETAAKEAKELLAKHGAVDDAPSCLEYRRLRVATVTSYSS